MDSATKLGRFSPTPDSGPSGSSTNYLQRDDSSSQRRGERAFSKSPSSGLPVAHSDLSELQTSEGGGRGNQELRKVVKKRRTDRSRTQGGGESSSTPGHHHTHHGTKSSSSSSRVKPAPVSMGSRLARCQWVVVMFTPLTLLLLHRMEAVVAETGNAINTQTLLTSIITLGLVCCVNELLDGLHWPYFVISAALGAVFGATVKATEDLIAARMLTVALFGIGAGLARYHWNLSAIAHEQLARYERRRLRRAGGATSSGGDGSPANTGGAGMITASDSDGHGLSNSKGKNSSPTGDNNNKSSSQGLLSSVPTVCAFLVSKIGLTVWFAGGELVGISVFVEEGISAVILPSWSGYLLLILFPILTYKVSSWVSHALTLMFGSSRSVSNAGWMLAIYWVGTTVLSLGILFAVIFYSVWSWVPYVWGLQLVVAPYGIVTEYIANESRKVTRENPYREVVAAYKEHIDSTKQDRKKYHC